MFRILALLLALIAGVFGVGTFKNPIKATLGSDPYIVSNGARPFKNSGLMIR